jgi:hypothetical protein
MTLDISASVRLIRQLVAAVAMLHENARDVAHGAIGPERIIVTPNARIVIVEYVLGAALEQLHFSQERYWKELRIALPPSTGLPRFDHRADVTQIGLVALSMILGRLLHEDEYPSRVGDVLAGAWAISSKGELEPLPPRLRQWIGRALQLEPHHSFATALEARDELDRVLSGDDEEDEDDDSSVSVATSAELDAPVAPVIAPPAVEPPAPQPDARYTRSETSYGTTDSSYGKTDTSHAKPDASYGKTDSSYGKSDASSYLKSDPPSSSSYGKPESSHAKGDSSYVKSDTSSYGKPETSSYYSKPDTSFGKTDSSYGRTEPPIGKADNPFSRLDPPAPKTEASSSGWVTVSRPITKSDESSIIFKKDEPIVSRKEDSKKEEFSFLKKTEPVHAKEDTFAAPAAKHDAGHSSWKSSFTLPTSTAAASSASDDDDADEGSAETSGAWRPMGKIAAAAVALIVISAGGVYAGRKLLTSGSGAAANGTLNINSNPPGAQVVVDGQVSGVTPLSLAMKAGPHNVELRGSGDPRQIPVTITAGKEVSQYIELPKVTAFGQLQVRTDPAGANVTVDRIPRGKSPVLVESLASGEHSVVLEVEGGTAPVKQTVSVEAGMTASLVVPMAPVEAAPVSGWIAVSAPVELQIFEGKRLVGTSQSDRLMMVAGRHDVEFVNETLGYRQTKTVQVAPGKTAPVKIDWPKGNIAINALPWADVWIDGERIGETPIGNLSLPIGPHEILFRHPELGEQRYATTVSLKAPVRVSVDLRKK